MTTAADEDAVARRRATVAKLLRDDLPQRKIAERLGVSKDVIYRDVQAMSRDAATPPDQDNRGPRATDILDVALPAATPPEPPATASRDTATPAAPGLTLPLDAALVADLATLTRNGTTPEAAIRHAVAHLAKGYRLAWGIGLYPRDIDPVLSHPRFHHYQPATDETAPADARKDQG
ncbi:helix-turn-helix domain-containing protein [Streptomyces sp. NPDC057674]|uniref:helix-turn-helix domain-containing protein n=1 Tax=Streptomyces sp. NPDC057674 TaxID=3346203 RepID=UPI003688D443